MYQQCRTTFLKVQNLIISNTTKRVGSSVFWDRYIYKNAWLEVKGSSCIYSIGKYYIYVHDFFHRIYQIHNKWSSLSKSANLDKYPMWRERNPQEDKCQQYQGNIPECSRTFHSFSLTKTALNTVCRINKQITLMGWWHFCQKKKKTFKSFTFLFLFVFVLSVLDCCAVSHCSSSVTLTVCFTDQWPLLYSVSGMMKRSDSVCPPKSGLEWALVRRSTLFVKKLVY